MGHYLELIKGLLKRNYYLARISSHLWYFCQYNKKKLLIVYQMGKVGSSSIVESLNASDLNLPVLQVHFLSHDAIKEMERRYYGELINIFQDSLLPETKHLFLSYYLRQTLDSNHSLPRWKFVTLIRDPLARSASVFFYSVDTPKKVPYLPDFYKHYQDQTVTIDMLIQRFQEVLIEDPDEFQLPLHYFDRELGPVTGIDVYAREFPKQQGYSIYHGEHTDLLLIKLELMRDCAKEAFREFLGLQDFQLVNANLASQKRYYPIYIEFLKSIKLPQSYLDTIYNSKYMRHFYTENEIESFWRRWIQQSAPSF
ncbi:MAG: putative capsular polysaccharide synthesis family protein [Anaerolineales bacterium]|jgi:hypothetical protein